MTSKRSPLEFRRLVFSSFSPSAQGSMSEITWDYPILTLPECLGCIALGMVYYDIAPGGILRSMVSIVPNATFWAGGIVAYHLGEPEGRAVAETDDAYVAFVGLLLALLLFHLVSATRAVSSTQSVLIQSLLLYSVFRLLVRLIPLAILNLLVRLLPL